MWLRWSWRDLRRRWVQVAAIALVLALGTGTFAGLTSLTRWRIASNDASFELTQMWDLRAELPLGTEVPQGSLHAALEWAMQRKSEADGADAAAGASGNGNSKRALKKRAETVEGREVMQSFQRAGMDPQYITKIQRVQNRKLYARCARHVHQVSLVKPR